MTKTSYSLITSILLLSAFALPPSLAHSSIKTKSGLFSHSTFDDTPCNSKIQGVFNTQNKANFEHTPVQNPGGAEFNLDNEFVQAYEKYQKFNHKEEVITTNSGDKINTEEVKNRFNLYKLAGAKPVNTKDAGWDVNYIAPKKSSTQKAVDAAKGLIDHVIDEYIPEDPTAELLKLTDKTLSSISDFNKTLAGTDKKLQSNNGIFGINNGQNDLVWLKNLITRTKVNTTTYDTIFDDTKKPNSIFKFNNSNKQGEKTRITTGKKLQLPLATATSTRNQEAAQIDNNTTSNTPALKTTKHCCPSKYKKHLDPSGINTKSTYCSKCNTTSDDALTAAKKTDKHCSCKKNVSDLTAVQTQKYLPRKQNSNDSQGITENLETAQLITSSPREKPKTDKP